MEGVGLVAQLHVVALDVADVAAEVAGEDLVAP